MTNGYRAVLRLPDDQDAIRVANEQFRSWLVGMVRDPRKSVKHADWDGPGVYALGPESVLTVVEQGEGDDLHRLLLEYVERNRSGVWTTRVYAMSSPAHRRLKQVLWIEGEGERHDGSMVQPGTPKVVRHVLEAVEARDGSVPVLSKPRIVRSGEVDELVGFIVDEFRDLSVVVAMPIPGVPVDRWAAAVSSLMRDALGCASFFVLDEAAAAELNAKLGQAHSVPIGALRTFVPRVELGDWADARRHRMLTARTMSRGLDARLRFSERLVRAVARTPRQHLLEGRLPGELTRTSRVLQRAQLLPRDLAPPELSPEPPARPDADAASASEFRPTWVSKLHSLVQKISGRDAIDDAAIEAIADQFELQEDIVRLAAANAEKLQIERERLEDQVASLRQQLEAEQFERALADLGRRDAERKTRSLERWRSERPDRYSYVEDPDVVSESDPVSVSEIIERLTDEDQYGHILRYVELTDVEKAIDRAEAVDAVDPNGTYASSFWEYVLVLRDYMIECAEHGFTGNVHMYLSSNEVRGRKCPAQRHRPNESDTVQTNAKMRRERQFPVPAAVDPSGSLFMTTHFAPTHRDQNAPRMYYHVDPVVTKKAYIGYIGVHLTNTKTN